MITAAAHRRAARSAADEDGAILAKARADKERKYAELTGGGRCRLVVVAIECGGRWSEEAFTFIQDLAAARSPSPLPTKPSADRPAHEEEQDSVH